MKRCLTAVATVLLVAVTACGESEDNSFREDYNQAVKPLSELNSDIGNSISTPGDDKKNAEVAQQFEALAAKTEQTRANLSELDAPEDAKEELDKLLAALQGSIDDFKAVAQAAKDSDPAAAKQAAEDLQESGAAIGEAETALQNAVDG
jgi:alanyl-tRNA synthetase